jgi:hypothetical protein
LQANKPVGLQTVPPFHILPRYTDDGVGLAWSK